MEDPLERIARMKPLAVLLDRSPDVTERCPLAQVEPYHAIRVTDHRSRLTRRVLAAHDMVVICGHGVKPYSKAERAALVEFVEGGGALILAASAGVFETRTGRSIDRLAIDRVAREFGFRYLSAGAYPRRHENYRHARRQDLVLTAAGRRIGFDLEDTRLLYPAPIEAPGGATVLLREKRTGAPVFARARVGRGTVAVYGDAAIWSNGWTTFHAILHLTALAPRRRVTPEASRPRPPAPVETIVDGRLEIRFAPAARTAAERLLGLAKVVVTRLRSEIGPPKPPDRVIFEVEPGTSIHGLPGGPKQFRYILGSDLSDGALVESLTRTLVYRLLMPWWGGRRPFPFVMAAHRHLKVLLLERLGLHETARSWIAAMSGGDPVDAGRTYSQTVRFAPAMCRFFRDVEERFGRGAFRKMCRAIPKSKPFDGFPDLFTALDRFAFFLARTSGSEVYDWLETTGHTVRRLPLEEPGSDAFRAGVDRTLRRNLADVTKPISARLAAARELADRVKDGKGLVARARGKTPARALPAAIALARSRDERALSLLTRWWRSRDDGLAAVAALFGVTEFASRTAADRLFRLAADADTVFRLAAGRALRAVGDERSERYSFDALEGCAIRHWRNGHLRSYASVDGQDVAVVHVGPRFWCRGYGRANSRNYVFWVHTDGPFRRLGIAGDLFDAAIEASPWSRAFSEVALHAMSDYFAHALYRDRGMIDSRSCADLTKDVHPTARRAPKGVRIRPALAADARAAEDLARRTHELRAHPDVRFTRFPGDEVVCVAEEGREIRAVAVFGGTSLNEFAVDPAEDAKRRERIALALLAFAERQQARRGETTLIARTWLRYDDPTHVRWLQRAGFSSKASSLVEQSRISDLGRFLAEIEGVLEARLAAAKLPARRITIGLDGGEPRLRATLRIDGRRVRARAGGPEAAGIVLRGAAEAIQGVALGITAPFTELNQCRLEVLPTPNGETRRRLAALFPVPE